MTVSCRVHPFVTLPDSGHPSTGWCRQRRLAGNAANSHYRPQPAFREGPLLCGL